MKRFDVLDRQQEVRRSYLLEASAGTGKTFAIENTVVRFLLEDDGGDAVSISQILVVTFTRAATQELKARIRRNIEMALNTLSDDSVDIPDYLCAYKERGEEALVRGKQRLEDALYNFDQAQIFTIHGFCSRMLREHLFDSQIMPFTEESVDDKQIVRVMRDFLRTELHGDIYSPGQLKIILEEYANSTEKLEQALLKLVRSSLDIDPPPDFSTLLAQFQRAMQGHRFTSKGIVDDFCAQAPMYEKLSDRSGTIKEEVLEKVKRFANLFDLTNWIAADFDLLIADGLFLLEALDPSRLKKSNKGSVPKLRYPDLLLWIRENLKSIVEQARSPICLLARFGHGCQKLLRRYFEEEEKMGFDDLLRTMAQAITRPEFASKVRSSYRLAIVDEFQDTDPLQWKIFRELFNPRESYQGHLYLVGDPKQSIYAFRQADIYTYLSAADVLGSENHASLDTNFRSQPALVKALNTLFSSEVCSEMFPLPRLGHSLECVAVRSAPKAMEKNFRDYFGALHFCVAEEATLDRAEGGYLFPFFAEEISRLHSQDGVSFRGFAILVSDRFQADRVSTFLQSAGIPVAMQRSSSLANSSALPALKDLMEGVLHPKQTSKVKKVLGGALFRWNEAAILGLSDQGRVEQVLSYFYTLRDSLLTKGCAAFFAYLLRCPLPGGAHTFAESLLKHKEGAEIYDDFQQLMHLLMERENQTGESPEQLIAYLDTLLLDGEGDQEKLRKSVDPTQEAVQVLTMHMSKGLEFDIVFALGLCSRTKAPSTLCPVVKENGLWQLCSVDPQSEAYLTHCREVEAEKMRQLYVAMTRAKSRLYVPVFLSTQEKIPVLGSSSPMELYLNRVARGGPVSNAFDILKKYDHISCEKLTERSDGFKQQLIQSLSPSLRAPIKIEIPQIREEIYSFTSLTSHGVVEDQVKEFPRLFQISNKTAHTLPAGSECGLLLHKILETIPFQIGYDELMSKMFSYTQGTPFKGWESVIANMVLTAVRMPLQVSLDRFSLGEIDDSVCYREIEFLYPCDEHIDVPELENRSGFVKGVMDLVFRHRDKYYLVDWKSNWLGSTIESYRPDSLRQAMHQQQYFLQAKIYRSALERYLRLIDDRPFDAIFGGTFYVFLRGVDEEGLGVFKV